MLGASDARQAGFGTALAAFSAVTFGFGTTCARLAYEGGGSPLTVVTLRFAAFVLIVGLLVLILRRSLALKRKTLRGTLWMAVALALVSLGYQGSVAFIPVSLAALIFYTFPLLVGLLAAATGRDRMTTMKAAALLAAFAGLALALGPGYAELDWRGIALALTATLGMTLTLTFGGDATRGEDALVLAVFTNLWMLVAFVIIVAAAGGLALPVTQSGAIGVLGTCASYVVAYVCWFAALSLVRPVRLAALFNIEPLVTLLVAALVLGERLSASQLVGAGLVFASIVSLTSFRARGSDA